MRPRAIRGLAGKAATSLIKEVTALERLASGFPPTPHVVRFLDTGVHRIAGAALDLPWIAIERANGGADGTTLRARVGKAIERSGHAFGAERARLAVGSMVAGVDAMHQLGVIHRDLNPANVLCSGWAV